MGDEEKKAAATPKASNGENSKTDKKKISAACKAYGIDEKYVASSAIRPDGTVVIATQGGKKVTWKEGQEVKPEDRLTIIEASGINPAWIRPKKVGIGPLGEDAKRKMALAETLKVKE